MIQQEAERAASNNRVYLQESETRWIKVTSWRVKENVTRYYKQRNLKTMRKK